MSTSAELARATAWRTKYAPKVANGLTFFSPLFAKIFHGRRSAPGSPLAVLKGSKPKGIEWNHGGDDYTWLITKSMPTATVNRGEMGTRSFDQPSQLAKAVVSKYNTEQTAAISEGDYQANKNDETKLDSLWKRRAILAQSAVWLAEVKGLWGAQTGAGLHGASTINFDGLSYIVDTGNVAAGSYAGIAMATTNPYWTPTSHQYATVTLAANALEILSAHALKLTRSEEADGAGMQSSPDFAVFNVTSWTHIITFCTLKHTWMGGAGGIQDLNMVQKGFVNIWINGIDCFPDNWWGGAVGTASGYIESQATDEYIMGHSDRVGLATCASPGQGEGQGLVQGTIITDPVVIRAKQAGVFQTGLHCIFFESPVWFGLGYV